MIEYKVITQSNPRKLEDQLNQLAGDGWRVVTAVSIVNVSTALVLERQRNGVQMEIKA